MIQRRLTPRAHRPWSVVSCTLIATWLSCPSCTRLIGPRAEDAADSRPRPTEGGQHHGDAKPDRGDAGGDAEKPTLSGDRLSAELTTGSPFDVRAFLVTPDSARVAYVGDRGDVWVATLESGASRRLTDINPSGDPRRYARLVGLSADGTDVVYTVSSEGIYAVNLDARPPARS